MGIKTRFTVVSPLLLLAFLCSSILLVTSSSVKCDFKRQYFDYEAQECFNCTRCDQIGLVMLRPCHVNRDTTCDTPEKLWKLLLASNPAHEHHTVRHNHHKNEYERKTTEELVPVMSTEAPFSSMENLVWDWQAIALTFAVFSCILFFFVIAMYSLHQARQWRRLKENFDADVEELSARLSLMAASTAEKGESLEPNFGAVHSKKKLDKCMYLDQLLNVVKDEKVKNSRSSKVTSGNVYIEEGNATAIIPNHPTTSSGLITEKT